ncbi:fasciclin domain-containing protein [Pseudoalteromonas agarivorans]|uniref:fasciclin domain-containing protein n=1 Tax=Pseudoalteromonas agarivorans TaxID=176102 RepID=UPI00311EDFAA
MFKNLIVTLCLVVATLGDISIAYADEESVKKDIINVALENGSLNTFSEALSTADLAGTLKGQGPFTVFAPTDKAFAALPQDTLKVLLQPENREKLIEIINFHLVADKLTGNDMVKATHFKSVQGQILTVSTEGGRVMINNAGVTMIDVEASNGVIHLIDTVLLPKE